MQMIFQDPYESLNPRMTAASIVSEPFRIHKIGTRKEQRERTEELFEQVGLKRSQLDRYPHEFSGGQRQRIAIARALLKDAPILIMDEPAANLDPETEHAILQSIHAYAQNRMLLTITHRPAALHMADQVIILSGGRVVGS